MIRSVIQSMIRSGLIQILSTPQCFPLLNPWMELMNLALNEFKLMIQLRCICSIYSNLVPLTSKEMIDFHTLSYTSTVKSLFYYALEARKTQYSFQVQSFSILGHYREYLSGSFLLIGSYIIIPEERIHIKREQKCC